MNTQTPANPFAAKPKKQLTRRAFSKSVFAAGLALGAAPAVLPNILSAATVDSMTSANALRNVITQQLWSFNSETSLASATQDDAFHGFLGQHLADIRTA